MSLERVRCNLNDEFEAEEAVNLSLNAEIEAVAPCDLNDGPDDGPIVTPTAPRSPMPVAVVRPRISSPFPVGYAEPDLLDLMEPVDPFDAPPPPTATPVSLDEVSLFGEVAADGDLENLNDGYVGLEQAAQLYEDAQLYNEVGLGMEQVSDNDEEVARINEFLDEGRPLSSLSQININIDTPSTEVTSVSSYPSLSEVDLTCNEEYEPNFGQVHFEDEAAASVSGAETTDNNNDSPNDDSQLASASASMTSASTSSAPPPYQPRGSFRCHQCGALNNVATTSWASPPPPYASPATPTDDAHVPAVADEPVGPVVAVPAADDDGGVALNDLFSGSDERINIVGLQPGGPDFDLAAAAPPQSYDQVDRVPFRELLGPADTSDEEDK